jgi:hypothetical protein
MTAEWYDDVEQQDWILAKWGCRRLERAAVEIVRLREEVLLPYRAAAAASRTAHLGAEKARRAQEDAEFELQLAAGWPGSLAA